MAFDSSGFMTSHAGYYTTSHTPYLYLWETMEASRLQYVRYRIITSEHMF